MKSAAALGDRAEARCGDCNLFGIPERIPVWIEGRRFKLDQPDIIRLMGRLYRVGQA